MLKFTDRKLKWFILLSPFKINLSKIMLVVYMGYTIKTTNTAIQDSPPPLFRSEINRCFIFYSARTFKNYILSSTFNLWSLAKKYAERRSWIRNLQFIVMIFLWYHLVDVSDRKKIPMTLLNSYQYFFDYIEDNN